MIKIKQLSKSYPIKANGGFRLRKKQEINALTDVSFTAENGQITGLLGANGAGKSTTLRIIASLVKPDTGQVIVDGFDVEKQALKVRSQLGFLPHNSGVYPRLTAMENIRYYAEICGMKKKEIDSRIDELVFQLEMEHFAERRTEGLSLIHI